MIRRRASNRYDVAFYVPWVGPLLARGATTATGGAETQIFLLARELARRGCRVRLLVFDVPGTHIPAEVDGVAVAVRPPYRARQRLGKVRETLSLGRAVLDAEADVVVARSAGPDIGLTGMFARRSGSRFVYSSASVADFDYATWLSPPLRDRILFRLGVRLADQIVVQSTEQVRLCEQAFGRSPVLIRSIAEPAPQRELEPEAFLWIGRLVDYKRPLAFVELARALPHARFQLVGVPVEHRGRREMVAAVERAAAEVPNLELLSQRPRREVLQLVERAVAIVSTTDFEGMPNVFLEGWGRGVPSLALSCDPDGVIERHRLGGFAHGSQERLVELAAALWEQRHDQSEVALRCRGYIRDHHAPDVVAAGWQELLGGVPAAAGTRTALAG